MSIAESRVKTGGEIDAWCGKCKMELNHVVIAKVGERVARVKCLTCNTEHGFKRTADVEERKARAEMKTVRVTPGAAKKVAESDEARWQREVASATGVTFRKYAMTEAFNEGAFLDHPTFGRGKVVKLENVSSASVLFRTGLRLLAVNYQKK